MRVIWLALFAAVMLFEGIALGSGHVEWTLSYNVRVLRFDPVGRFFVLPLGTWLLWHLLGRAQRLTTPTGYDVAALVIGLAWAILEATRH